MKRIRLNQIGVNGDNHRNDDDNHSNKETCKRQVAQLVYNRRSPLSLFIILLPAFRLPKSRVDQNLGHGVKIITLSDCMITPNLLPNITISIKHNQHYAQHN